MTGTKSFVDTETFSSINFKNTLNDSFKVSLPVLTFSLLTSIVFVLDFVTSAHNYNQPTNPCNLYTICTVSQ